MSQVLVRLRILPSEAGIGASEVSASVQRSLPASIEVKRIEEEPIAFGIIATIMDFLIEEREGVLETLEKSVRSSNLVSDVTVLGVSRYSVRVE